MATQENDKCQENSQNTLKWAEKGNGDQVCGLALCVSVWGLFHKLRDRVVVGPVHRGANGRCLHPQADLGSLQIPARIP